MNIPQMSGLRFVNPFRENVNSRNVSAPNYGLKMAEPLTKDTVSFHATPKELQSRALGVSLDTARRVHEAALPMQTKVHDFVHQLFGDLVATDINPKNPLYIIRDRAKKPKSIVEKSCTRQYNSKSEILTFMTDLNGAKIVLKGGNKKVVQKVLSRLIEPIQRGEIELIQIENKRPEAVQKYKGVKREQYDYASIDFLEELQRVQEDKWESMNLREERLVATDWNDPTKVNYVAIHMLLKFPEEERPFELMIMGKDVHDLKELDDKLFKILDNKEVDRMYKPLVELIAPLKEKGNEALKAKFDKYRGDAFIFQREKEPSSYVNPDAIPYFLPLNVDLPPQFDLNNLYRIMLECEGRELPSKSARKHKKK